MNYQTEYASLVGRIDRVISLLELHEPGDPTVQRAIEMLHSALCEAEERYITEQ